jgi:hypothetical protein
MLLRDEVKLFYKYGFKVPPFWNLSRKHFRIETHLNHWVKLNKLENRLNQKELRKWLVKFTPLHVYMSALDWLFPERVGKKYKADYARPIRGDYIIDIDYDSSRTWHRHRFYGPIEVCEECLERAKQLTIETCEVLEDYYSKIVVVFSGNRGFHIHVLDFNPWDHTKYNPKEPVKSFEKARFKFTLHLTPLTWIFNRHHFIVSVDPMRVITVPNSLNAETGLRCLYLGGWRNLESLKIRNLVDYARPTPYIWPYLHQELISCSP